MGIETLALVAAGTALAGGAVGAIGAIKQGQAAQGAANYNAAVANQRAASERDAAKAEAADTYRHGMFKVGSAIAGQGASGVTPEGSPLLVDEATIREVALGASHTLYSGERRARMLENEGQLSTAEGKNA